jgi:hypothetical protein
MRDKIVILCLPNGVLERYFQCIDQKCKIFSHLYTVNKTLWDT